MLYVSAYVPNLELIPTSPYRKVYPGHLSVSVTDVLCDVTTTSKRKRRKINRPTHPRLCWSLVLYVRVFYACCPCHFVHVPLGFTCLSPRIRDTISATPRCDLCLVTS